MTTIVRLHLESVDTGVERWDRIAAQTSAWALAKHMALRDACMLLPFAQLLPLARRSFARAGGWMPRIETTQTLAASLGPASVAPAGQISFDAISDALSATALLRSQPWGTAWARRDPRAFRQGVRALVEAAHALARASFALAPAQRAAHWAHARDLLGPGAGPGATERLLARVALEWACLAPAPATDRLFTMTQPSAWIAVQAGLPDRLVDALMAESAAPSLSFDMNTPEDAPFDSIAANPPPAIALCDGFEHEAQCAAAQVLAHVQRGEWPVALIAQDRVLVRRVRALLAREPIRLLDETGWKLSTTRAGAQVMALLRAADANASTDAWIDWLKTLLDHSAGEAGAALSSLEAACRRGKVSRADSLHAVELEPAAARLRASAAAALAPLGSARSQSLSAWLAALSTALSACHAMPALQDDDAGRQALAALRLARGAEAGPAWASAARDAVMGLAAFRDWVDEALEQATFLPTPAFDADAHVVITPMARAMLRPFAAIVFPGADDQHLGAAPAAHALLNDAQAAALGLTTAAQRRSAELQAFVQLLQPLGAPRLTFLRRRMDGGDVLGDSPLVERLSLALASRGLAMSPWRDPRVDRQLVPTPIRMSAPSAPELLPQRLSASACEALRACPYRFFALYMLRLREDDELDREVEKRDYGTWLHAVLFAFHTGRVAPAASDVEIAQLLSLAERSQAEQGLADADFLPFAASFASFAPRYIVWLHARDAQGARWLSGEDDISAQPEALGGTELRGIVDRIDALAGQGIELIDYKTGSAASLRDKVKEPLEDTQLAFYAALVRTHGRTRTDQPIAARYLALDGSKRLEEVEHPQVERSADALVEGLAHDLRRLRAGAGLPALGAGSTCDHCAARGVCRRDHWAEAADAGVST